MSDNYDPLSANVGTVSFRGLDASKDTVSIYGRTTLNAPVAVQVDSAGLIQIRQLTRALDEIVLIGTDTSAAAHPVVTDAMGNLVVVQGTSPWAVSSGLVKSTLNSTTTPLAASGVFTGGAEDTSGHEAITVSLTGSPSNATGQLSIQFSPDGVNWDVQIPLAVADLTAFIPFPLRNVLPFFRVVYTNGATLQSTFRLTTILHRVFPGNLTRFLTNAIKDSEPVLMTRGAVVGKDTSGGWNNVGSYIATISSIQYPSQLVAVSAFLADAGLKTLNTPKITAGTVGTTTATMISAGGALAGRKAVIIKADPGNTKTIYWGFTNPVTPGANGYPLSGGDAVDLPGYQGQALFVISSSGTQNWIVLESAD